MQETRVCWLHGSDEMRSAAGRRFALLQIGGGVEQMLSPSIPDMEND